MDTSIESTALNSLHRIRESLLEEGYTVDEPERGNFCYSIEVNKGKERVKLITYFGKKGIKTVLQGNSSGELYRSINTKLFGEKLFSDTLEFIEPQAYIGTDESGKGDYFGPLVIAGVLVDPDSRLKLQKIGVRDSKKLSDFTIQSLSSQIKKIIKGKINIVIINPEKYNSLYSKISNVNTILGWAHARVIENILIEHQVPEAVSDKFGNPKIILSSLMDKGKTIKLHQEIKAEKYSGVAAASILARNEVISWFDRMNKKYNAVIPKGASLQVEAFANNLKVRIGEEEMKKLIKFHFKTSKKIFSR